MTHLVQVLLFFTLLPLIALPQQKETWITKPSDQWPSIALINKVQFKNGDRYVHPSFSYAGTGFLIDYKNDTFAATAKHSIILSIQEHATFPLRREFTGDHTNT